MTFCQEVFKGLVRPHDLNPLQPFGCAEKNLHKFFHILDMLLVNNVDDIIVGNDSHQNILAINHPAGLAPTKATDLLRKARN